MAERDRAAVRDTLIVLQDAQTVGNGKALAVGAFTHHIFYIKGNGVIGAGAITIETADTPEYAGTWAALPSYTDPTLNVNPTTVVSSAIKIYSYIGKLGAVRARISTTVTTTTVTVLYKGGN
jgi:hypothetical protein